MSPVLELGEGGQPRGGARSHDWTVPLDVPSHHFIPPEHLGLPQAGMRQRERMQDGDRAGQREQVNNMVAGRCGDGG